MSTRHLRAAGFLAILAVLSPILVALLVITIADDKALVRLRNSLIYDIVTAQSLRWDPERVPESFTWESSDAPHLFRSALVSILNDHTGDRLESALRIAGHLVTYERRSGVPVQSTLATTYRAIIKEGRGYCSDYTATFGALALAAGIPVREWGLAFDGFGGDGHAFNEIYYSRLNKWLFVDPFYSFFVMDAQGTPLSALEFREYLLNDQVDSVVIKWIDGSNLLLPSDRYAFEYYQRGVHQMFLLGGNNLFSYDGHWLIQLAGSLSRALEQSAAILVGLQPRLLIIGTDQNQDALRNLGRLRLAIYCMAFLFVSGIIAGIVTVVLWFKDIPLRRA